VSAALPVGIGAAAVASLLLSTGTLLQALDARRADPRHGLRLSLLGHLLRRPRWVAGTVVGFLAFPFQLIALAHAPLVIVQPVYASSLLWLLIGGVVLLEDHVHSRDMLAATVILLGPALVTWGAPSGADRPTSEALFAVVVGILAVLALAPYPRRERCGRVLLMVSAALGFAAANLAIKGFSDELGRSALGPAAAYLAVAALSTTTAVLGQMTAFQRHRAIEVLPLTYAIPIFLPALLGLLLLHEHWSTAAFGGDVFAAGAVLLVVGTAAVARSQPVVDVSARAAG
jgi:drug/metabolite transporter (DMT)-like permease